MKKMLTVLCVLLLLVGLTLAPFDAAAAGLEGTTGKGVSKDILNSLGLEVVERIPDDIKPVEINSEEELRAYMNAISSMTLHNVEYSDEIRDIELHPTSSGYYYIVNRQARHTYTTVLGTQYHVNLTAIIDIWVNPGGYLHEIVGCHQYTSLTGAVISLGWEETYANHQNQGDQILVYGGGILSGYLLFEGSMLLWSREEHLSLTYIHYF